MNIMSFNEIQIYLKDKNELVGAIVLLHSIKKVGVYIKSSIYVKQSSKKFDNLLKIFFDNIQSFTNEREYYNSNCVLFNHTVHYDDIRENMYIFNEMPYAEEGNKSIEEKLKIKEYVLWFSYYREILNKHFYLLDNEYFKEATKTLKYFTPQLSLNIPVMLENSNLKQTVSNLYNYEIRENEIYYHLDISKEYGAQYFYENKKVLKNNYNEYLKHNENTFIIICVGDEFIDATLNKYIFYKKTFTLNKKDLQNLIFAADTRYVYDERIKNLKKFKNSTYTVHVYYIDMDNTLDSNIDKNIFVCKFNKNVIAGLLQNPYIYNYMTLSKQTLLNLKYQSLKKWLCNNYKNIDNVIVYWFKNNSFIIIDTNIYDDILNQITKNKALLFFMKIYFKQTESKIIKNLHLFESETVFMDEIKIKIET